MAVDLWRTIHSERTALANDLDDLREDQWLTPSWCRPWTVQEVLAHMTATASMTPARFFVRVAAAGFRFGVMTDREVAAHAAGSPAHVLEDFRAHAADSTAPPGPVDSWLGETVVHAEDIRRAVGIAHHYPVDAVVRVADFYKRSNVLIGAKRRIDGLRLKATDGDWATGSGPEVQGPLLSLVLAMTGRSGALADLTGAGVPTLASRTSA
jgi:uncharacterized protein (TIGR03083 family)